MLLLLFMLVLALLPALRSVQGLTTGAVVDLHRDEAFVRAILEGHYGVDPTYREGGLWYTPLNAWIETVAVWITGLPVAEVIVQMGPWFNLLAPVSFFIMVWYFLGPLRAAASTAAFLFFSVGQEPGWAVATYAARMIPSSASQWLFYLELILIHRAVRSGRAGPFAVAGTGAGITFLAHAAPAFIAVLLIAWATIRRFITSWRHGDKPAMLGAARAGLVAGAAFLVATLPLTWYLFGNGTQVLNRAGAQYTYYSLSLDGARIFLYHNLSMFNLFGLAGLWLIIRGHALRELEGRGILLAWPVLSVALAGYCYSVAVLESRFGIHLPTLVPSFHFYLYTKGALALFAGIAAWELFSWIRSRALPKSDAPPQQAMFSFIALIALACTVHYPSYATRRDLAVVRARNLAFKEDRPGVEAAAAINRLVPWEGVVLCSIDLSLWPVLPSARHVVATASTMSNPYLDERRRLDDNEQLLDAMRSPRTGTAQRLEQYGVTHLLVRADGLAGMPEAKRWFPVEVFRNEAYVLLARRPAHGERPQHLHLGIHG